MSAELLRTPTCEVTGLPLPILPNEPQHEARSSFSPNTHHHFHPEKSPVLMTVAGLAVRGCRVQRVNHDLHTNYHYLFSGPEGLPITDDEVFEVIVKSVAGVVPRRALDVSRKGDYREVTLSRHDHAVLTQPRVMDVGNRGNVSVFLAEYTAQKEIEAIIPRIIIDEFLDPHTDKRRKNLIARDMLAEALDISLADLNHVYKDLKKEGYTPQRAETFRKVAKRLVRRHSLGHYRIAVTERLIAA